MPTTPQQARKAAQRQALQDAGIYTTPATPRYLRRLSRDFAQHHAKREAEEAQIEAGTHERRSGHVWRKAKSERPKCGARCRTGQPCRARVMIRADGTLAARCRMHGGASTGPRSEAGREAIAASNRRRALARREATAKAQRVASST